MTEWLGILHLLTVCSPLAFLALTVFRIEPSFARRAVVSSALLSLGSSLALFLVTDLGGGLRMSPAWAQSLSVGGRLLFRLDELSLPLFPMAGLIWAGGLLVSPRRSLTVARMRRSAASYACLVLAFSTESPALLAGLWVLSSSLLLLEHRGVEHVRRVAGLYLGVGSLSFVSGALLLELFSGEPPSVAFGLLAIAVLIRKGILPLHSWLPASFERGHLIPSLLFSTPQLGTYAAAVLILPRAAGSTITVMASLALATCLYGAIAASVESDARRTFGFLFMSQSALVLAGLDSATVEGVGGSLSVWLASALATSGLGFAIACLESRRGRLSLERHHGGFDQMPLLAGSFLIMGLASVGFPGTLGFLGEELLVGGSVARFPWVGFVTVVATALNGITVLRMYFSLFCGRRELLFAVRLRQRELFVFSTLALFLLIGGLFPKAVTESRSAVAAKLLGSSK